MQDELEILSLRDYKIAKVYAFLQQAITGIPYEECLNSSAIRIKNKLFAPEKFVQNMSNGGSQFDWGALVYEVARFNGMTKDESDREESRFLDLADYHFAYGHEPIPGDGIAESMFETYLETGYYSHTTKTRDEMRPFRA